MTDGRSKLIHFSDGSTMEVQEEDTDTPDLVPEQEPHPSLHRHSSDPTGVPVDPKTMSWPVWMKHYSHKGTGKVMNGLEYTGETLAYYLGITTPKYQHEIDEYNRMVSKRASEDTERKAWVSSPSSSIVIDEQVKSSATPSSEEGTNGPPRHHGEGDTKV